MKNKFKFISITIIILLFFDQLSKYFIKTHLYFFAKVTLIKNFIDIVYVKNRGVAFGLLSNLSEKFREPFLIWLPLGIVVFLIGYILFTKKISKLNLIAFTLIIAGALGNLIDRFMFGYVIDFIDVYYKNFHWPAFNFADSYISIGTGLLVFDMIFGKKKGA